MIQKYVDHDLEKVGPNDKLGDLGLLNDDEAILVMVDEAHRSHTNTLHTGLLLALPNAARIGFTGTPIVMGAKKRTHEIFGEFIDRYTLRESEADGATVPILYEGRFAQGAVSDAAGLDDELAAMFSELSAEEREALKRKCGTLAAILEAEDVIREKAGDMLRHYVENFLPNGLKAQVVAISRRAAVRTRPRLRRRATSSWPRPRPRHGDPSAGRPRAVGKPKKVQRGVRAAPARWLPHPRLRGDDLPGNNDPREWKESSHGERPWCRIDRFKKRSTTRPREARRAGVSDRQVDAADRV